MCTHACTCTPSCRHMNTHASTQGWTWIMLGQHSRGGSLLICNFHVKVGKCGHLVIKLFSCYGISQDKSLLVVLVSLLIINIIVIICVYKAGWWSIKKGGKIQINGPFPILSLEFFFFSNYSLIRSAESVRDST